MNIEDVLSLVRAGYSKDEIAQMASADPAPAAAGADNSTAGAQQEPPAAAAADPEVKEEPQLTKLQAMIEKLASAVQAKNIKSTEQPTTKDSEAEDILFSVLH